MSGKAWHLLQASCCLGQIALVRSCETIRQNALEGLWELDNILETIQLYSKLCLACPAVAELHCG